MAGLRPSTRTRGSAAADGGHMIGNDVNIFAGDGAPTNGTSGTRAGTAGPGSLYSDYTNGKLYINTNTKASPTWTVVGTQSA